MKGIPRIILILTMLFLLGMVAFQEHRIAKLETAAASFGKNEESARERDRTLGSVLERLTEGRKLSDIPGWEGKAAR